MVSLRQQRERKVTLYDGNGRVIDVEGMRRRSAKGVQNLLGSGSSGWRGAYDENLASWNLLPQDVNTLLRKDLRALRARSRDLARNDDSCKRFLFLVKQNVLGYMGVTLQGANMLGNEEPDEEWNNEIEREWTAFGTKRRRGGVSQGPSACGSMSMRQMAWLTLWNKIIDGEVFIQILRGYPHNRSKFALRFLNPDLLDHSYCGNYKGRRIEMGVELDDFDRPVAYWFSKTMDSKTKSNSKRNRIRIPATQMIHVFRKEYIGQVRGIPEFAGVMYKTKMLSGVHEAIVVGWRVAAAKMGFFLPKEPEEYEDEDTAEELKSRTIDASPGSFDVLPYNYDLKEFNPDYPNSTYESGHKTFMQQIANGLNVSAPTLSNNYEGVNYSSLRQALLEDREGWRCVQAEMIDDYYSPVFEEFYDWSVDVTNRIRVAARNRDLEPAVLWQPRGWPWIDPEKEINAYTKAIDATLTTRQQVITETRGGDFRDTANAASREQTILREKNLRVPAHVSLDAEPAPNTETSETSDDNE